MLRGGCLRLGLLRGLDDGRFRFWLLPFLPRLPQISFQILRLFLHLLLLLLLHLPRPSRDDNPLHARPIQPRVRAHSRRLIRRPYRMPPERRRRSRGTCLRRVAVRHRRRGRLHPLRRMPPLPPMNRPASLVAMRRRRRRRRILTYGRGRVHCGRRPHDVVRHKGRSRRCVLLRDGLARYGAHAPSNGLGCRCCCCSLWPRPLDLLLSWLHAERIARGVRAVRPGARQCWHLDLALWLRAHHPRTSRLRALGCWCADGRPVAGREGTGGQLEDSAALALHPCAYRVGSHVGHCLWGRSDQEGARHPQVIGIERSIVCRVRLRL